MTIDSDAPPFRVGKVGQWENRILYDLYKEAYTPWEWQPELKKVADDIGIPLFSTPFDDSSVDFLVGMGVPAFKIASFEMVDLPLIRRVARTGKPIIMSTGMSTLDEIQDAVAAVRGVRGDAELCLLKCTSAYPANPEDMNLRTIPHLAEAFGVPAGLSDHSMGSAVAVASVALGACLIEKHFILSRSEGGPDSAFSMEPEEFRQLVRDVRTAERALGIVDFRPGPDELKSRPYRRSLFVVEDVNQGEPFTSKNVRSIRPANGLPPKHIEQVLGRTAAAAVKRGTPLSWEHVATRVAGQPRMRCVFRCDGTATTGLGHVSRCAALAEGLSEQGVSSLFSGQYSEAALTIIAAAGAKVEAAGDDALAADATIVDSYALTESDLSSFGQRTTAGLLVVIDDFARLKAYPRGSVILNFTVGAKGLRYAGEELRLLRGPQFLLARKALRDLRRNARRPVQRPRRFLVAIGGYDPLALSDRVARSLARVAPEAVVDIARGGRDSLASAFAACDAVVSGGGLTKYEAAYLALPVAVVSQTEEQAEETQAFAALGLAVDLGHGARLDDAMLDRALDSWISQGSARLRAQTACLATFPEDPTSTAAQAIVASIVERRGAS
jgi:N-acetylneuraminate synthase